MNAAPSLHRFATALERAVDCLLAAALATMVCAIVVQVVGRYALARAPGWSEELARFLLVWMTMLGAAVGMRARDHIAVTVLVDRLPARWRSIVVALRDGVVVAIGGLLVWFGIDYARLNTVQESAALEIPMSVPYAALPTGMALIVALVVLARWSGAPVRGALAAEP